MQKLFAVFALCLLAAVGLFGQNATGRVIGVVTDPSGSVIPKAKITVTNVDTGVSTETATGDDGSYQALLLPIGMYRVAAEAPGFHKTVTAPQKLEINQSLKIDIKLEVGSTAETVQVEANASGVETVNATLGTSVTATQIVNAPLNGRNVMDLALLVPGVVPGLAGPTTTAGGTAFSVAGSRTDSVTFLIDGGVNNNLLSNAAVLNPNPDAVEEFRILTSNYNAEYGRNGGGIVSVVTRSGTNTFHGSAYDYIRNADFNANSFFNNEFGLPKDTLKRNQFGASAGGPVLFPKFNGRNRFFFFVAYQGQRQTQLQSTSKTQVFTPAELNGDFSKSNAAGTGPDTNVVKFLQAYPYFQPNAALAAQGIIDPAKINSIAKNYIKNNLLTTSPTGFLASQGSAQDNRDELTEKVDLLITQADRLTVTLGSSRNPTIAPFVTANIPGYPNDGFVNHYFGSITYTKTISPRTVNEFRFTAQRNRGIQSVPGVELPKAKDLGIGITPDEPTGPPLLGFNSGMSAGFSPQGPTGLIDNTYIWSDNFIWTKGRHSFKAGFNYTPYQDNTIYDFYINGEFFFYGTGGGSFSQNDRADFLMGLPDEFLQFPKAPSNIRTHNIGAYFQDEWKVRKNLTLTLGLRYEYSSPKLDTQGRSFSLNYGVQSQVFVNAPKGLLFPGDPSAPVGSNFPDKNDWAPRFGFAWDPKGDGKMSIRGGFGVFYDILKGEDNLQFNGQAPFFGFADLFFDPLSANPAVESNYMSAPFTATGIPNSFPSKPPAKNLDFDAAGFLPIGGGGVYYVDPRLRTPYIYQYNLSIQREIMPNTTLEASYIGSSSHKLTGLLDSNPFVLGTTKRLFDTQPGVASGTFSYLDTFANVSNAHYDSLALGLNRRMSDTRFLGMIGYQFSYTYGHSIDNASGFRSRDSRVPTYAWGQFRGSSDFDLTHYVSVAATWELPFAKAWSSGPKRLTRGWTLYPIVSYRSGLPLDVTAGLSRTRTRPGPSAAGDPQLVRANLVSPISFTNIEAVTNASNGRSGNFYFDPAAFERASLLALYNNNAAVTNPALRTYGTLGRNAFRGPDRTNVNLTIGKVTDITERMKFEIRADFFNALNHPLFANPVTTITSGTFGQISSTGVITSGTAGDQQPRVIQLSARFTF
jgi:outer membrane receptor protein involved in Fe transport